MSRGYSSLSVGEMDNNAYLLDDGAGHLGLVDAAAQPQRLLDRIGGRSLDCVITTHRHADHIGALAEVVARTGAIAYCGRPDAQAVERSTGVHCRPVWTGDRIAIGALSLEVIGLVGHTPGSIALVREGSPVELFTGDSLFPGGLGRTAGPPDFASLFADVTGRIFERFGDDTLVLPGHGAPTMLAAERPQLEQWRRRGW